MAFTVGRHDGLYRREERVLVGPFDGSDDVDARALRQRFCAAPGNAYDNVVGQQLPDAGDLLKSFASVDMSEESDRLRPILDRRDVRSVADDVRHVDRVTVRVSLRDRLSSGLSEGEL